MFIVSLSAGLIAGSVWSNATRTLTTLAGQPATDIWGNATRTLTADFMPFASGSARGSLAINTTLDVRPSGAKMRSVTIVLATQSTGAGIGIYDGTNFDNDYIGLMNMVTGNGIAARGTSLTNGAAGPVNYAYVFVDRG